MSSFRNVVFLKATVSVFSWSVFLAEDKEVSGLIPGATTFSEWQWVWNAVHSTS
jgi:hypothetical protein